MFSRAVSTTVFYLIEFAIASDILSQKLSILKGRAESNVQNEQSLTVTFFMQL